MSQINTNSAWRNLLRSALQEGEPIFVHGKQTLELNSPRCLQVDMVYPVITIPERKLNYRFMLAEAHWILTGSNRVDHIRPYCAKLAEYSDDGKTFFGAYGPRFISQLTIAVSKLVTDKRSRQSCITLWRENPPETKDTPCTIALVFNIRSNGGRDERLNMHVFMRSSDIWLGLPYDIFNFSMMAYDVCCLYNANFIPSERIVPGRLFITSASSHVYESDKSKAEDLLCNSDLWNACEEIKMPDAMFTCEESLMAFLRQVKESEELLTSKENLIKLGVKSGLYETT